MTTLPKVLRESRKRLGLSRKELAGAISRAPSYIAALEDGAGEKTPSLDVLWKLAVTLSCPNKATALSPDRPAGISAKNDNKIALDIILSALGSSPEVLVGTVPWPIEKEMKNQSELKAGTHVWIITDSIAEAQDEGIARMTADNIVNNGISYSYFVPFTSPASSWRSAVESIASWIALRHQPLLSARVRVYQLSDCAFGSRMRISLSPDAPPEARYSVRAAQRNEDGKELHFYYSVPSEIASNTVHTLRRLVDARDEPKQPEDISCETGMLRKVFPEGGS